MQFKPSTLLNQLRRENVDALELLKKWVERYSVYIVLLNVLGFWLRLWAKSRFAPHALSSRIPVEPIEKIEIAAVALETLVLLLAGLKVYLDNYYLQDETKFWSHGCNRKTKAAIAAWFRGERVESRVDKLGNVHCPFASDAYVSLAANSPADAIRLNDINHRAYIHGHFGMKPEDLCERNNALMAKNPKTFLLIRDQSPDRNPIGMSCLLPLNRDAALAYRHGEIKDSEVEPRHIVEDFQAPSLVILFAIALDPNIDLPKHGKVKSYSSYLGRCFVEHFRLLMKDASGPYPPIVVTSDTSKARANYVNMGFHPTGKLSADGFELLEIREPFVQRPLTERDGQLLINYISPADPVTTFRLLGSYEGLVCS